MTRKAAPFIITAIALILTFLSAALSAAAFSDVPGDTAFAEAVDYVREKGLMVGTSSDRFSPDSTFTRAQMATVISCLCLRFRRRSARRVARGFGFCDMTASV